MDILAHIASLTESDYAPKWGGLGARGMTFRLRPYTQDAFDELKAKEGAEGTEAVNAARRAFAQSFIVSLTIDGNVMGQEAALASAMAYPGLYNELMVGSAMSAHVQDVPLVEDIVKGAMVLEQEEKGKGVRILAVQLFKALGGKDTEGND